MEATEIAVQVEALTPEQRARIKDDVIARYNGTFIPDDAVVRSDVDDDEFDESSDEPVRSGDAPRLVSRLLSPTGDDALLTPGEVAAMFRVSPKTIAGWARAGKISSIRTLGGHRRFRESEIRMFLETVEEAEVWR